MNRDISTMLMEGTVSSINVGTRTAQVSFSLLGGMVSGELKVLHHTGTPVAVEEAEVEYKGESKKHTHQAALLGWMPAVGQRVLCIYLPVEDGDGFVLGGL